MGKSVKKVVLAYSGGLDTSVILRWLIETYRCEVVAYCADLGQGEELIPIRDKALRTGAASVHIMDLREEFVRDFVFPMLRANAVYEGAYLLGTSIARPLIAKCQVEVARQEGADGVSHGATGKGNDQVRFELTYAALAPELTVIAPWREWELGSRTALIEFARRHDIAVPVTAERPYSTDRNLFHISYEGGILEDPWAEPPPKMFLLTNSPESAPDVPVYLELEYEAGDPVAVDGKRLSPAALLTTLNRLGGEHGIGRVDLVENRFVGMKSRGVYETRLLDQVQGDVTGTVRLKLYKGTATVAGRKSPRSLYRTDFATFEADRVYRQKDAEGFINLNALRLKIRALRDRGR